LKSEDLLLRVAVVEVYVDTVCLSEIRKIGVPCRPNGEEERRANTKRYAQTNVAHWCWGITVSEVGKHETTSLPALISQLVLAASEGWSEKMHRDAHSDTDQWQTGP
jgi:hypothetical protein